MAKISTRMALLAPDVARTFVRGGGSVSIAHFGHVDWQLGSAILADFHENSPALMSELISPHEEAIAKALSQISPTWFNESLMFLRVYRHVALQSFEAMLGQIDVVGAERGWSSALQGLNNNRVRGSRKAAREAIAWLIYCSRNRTDATGKLARTLAERFPEQSAPAAATLKPIEE